jgi:hypothetical protein
VTTAAINNSFDVGRLATSLATRLRHRGLVERRSELTPAQRSLQARIAAYRLHATHDPRETTKPARDAFMARFEREVDPDGRLPEAERRRRAEAAKKAYFSGLALKSSMARARRRSRP